MQSHNQDALKLHFKPAFLWLRALTAGTNYERATLSSPPRWMHAITPGRHGHSQGRMLGFGAGRAGYLVEPRKLSLLFVLTCLCVLRQNTCDQVWGDEEVKVNLWTAIPWEAVSVEEPASLCTTVTAYFPGMAWHFHEAHSVGGMQDICITLFSCDAL